MAAQYYDSLEVIRTYPEYYEHYSHCLQGIMDLSSYTGGDSKKDF